MLSVCYSRSDSVLFFSLPLCFVIVSVAAVKLVEHLSDSNVQPGPQKLDILLHAQIQYAIDALSQVLLYIWSQSNLERQTKRAIMRNEKRRQRDLKCGNLHCR